MRLSARQIEIFHAVMIYKSTIGAAESLATSQPTVSRELRELEKHIGFELFHRFGKRLTPTNQALLLHSTVSRSFVGMQEISRVALSIRQHNAAHLRIASLPAYAEALLPRVAERFLKQRRHVHLNIHSLEEVPLRHDLTNQLFDIGLVESNFDSNESITEQIVMGEQICILPPNHPLTAKTILAPSDFQDVNFVYYSQEDPYRRKIDRIFERHNVSRRYCVETTTATGICSMVAAGVGVSIVNPITALHYADKGVLLRPFSNKVPYHIHMLQPNTKQRSPHSDLFVDILRNVASEINAQVVKLVNSDRS